MMKPSGIRIPSPLGQGRGDPFFAPAERPLVSVPFQTDTNFAFYFFAVSTIFKNRSVM